MDGTPDIEKIVLHFSDGTTKEVNKGFIANMEVDDKAKQANLTVSMVNISGAEIRFIVEGMVEFGIRAGFFKEGGNG